MQDLLHTQTNVGTWEFTNPIPHLDPILTKNVRSDIDDNRADQWGRSLIVILSLLSDLH